MSAFAEYLSASAHKLLTDNRDLYVAQSRFTRGGKVAQFPKNLADIVALAREYEREAIEDAAPTTDTYERG